MRKTALILVLAAFSCVAGDALAQSSGEPHQDYPKLKVLGFGNFTFFAADDENAEVDSGFKEGQFVLHFAPALAPSFSVFAETTLTAVPTGTTADVERLIVKYSYNDTFKLAFGRFHTPINW